ncbi:mRpL44 [Drosophila busckii]|uniref:Large ribosomal subunit protein mL44 n=1 Tax=Drosophila busckii TaxID=30019 RepID=A0A0M4F4I4_DROBS|nr:39S ribosomal protein L44, mitochondrial [Drosophila busckii]ALC46650.1 mRpL44 [Drosophila busckii]
MSLFRSATGVLCLTRSINVAGGVQPRRHIKRWVSPTLRELAHRVQKQGPQKPEPRSGFIEWNYRSELFAFGKRLNEEFQLPLLQTAFMQSTYAHQEQERQRKLGIAEADLQRGDNSELIAKGAHIAKAYVEAYLRYALPKVPEIGHREITTYLLSNESLAHVSLHLGTKDLILSTEYPPSEETLAKTLQAIIGALADSNGVERAFLFVRDFICTQLNQKDLLEIWTPEQPMQLLSDVCKQRNLGEPEPRLLADCGKNTVLAAYNVGIYADRKLLGKGFGENVQQATETAAIDALQALFDMHDSRRPFDFRVQLEAQHVRLG